MKILCDCGKELVVGPVEENAHGIHVDINKIPRCKMTMLHIACECGRTPIRVDVGPPSEATGGTAETIRKRLGLEPWNEFADKMRTENLGPERRNIMTGEYLEKEKERRTGRSTRMLVNALAAMSHGLTVRIHGRGTRQGLTPTRILNDHLEELAVRLGIDPKLIVLDTLADVEFFDHLYWEMP